MMNLSITFEVSMFTHTN